MKCRTCAMPMTSEAAVKTEEGKFCDIGCHQWWLGYEGGKRDGYKKGREAAYEDGLDCGIDIAVTWFWQAVCLSKAARCQETADKIKRRIEAGDPSNMEKMKRFAFFADRYRKWAREE